MIHAVYPGGGALGVYAVTPFTQGQMIESAPYVALTEAEWQSLSRTQLERHCRLGPVGMVFSFGFTALYRSGTAANARLHWDAESGMLDILAARPIEAGEEILLPDGLFLPQCLPARPPVPAAAGEVRSVRWLSLGTDARLALVAIPAGEFLMGSDETDPDCWQVELPLHRLQLGAYHIARYPTTVAQYAAFVRATGYLTEAERRGRAWAFDGYRWADTAGADWQHPGGPTSSVVFKQDHPVTQVTWKDAQAFCDWSTAVSGARVSLPSEPEWERAARGPCGARWPWGAEPPEPTRCNFGLHVNDTTPAGAYSPSGDSPDGCADMAGNVWEWTADAFYDYPYLLGRPDESAEQRVVRGGGYHLCAARQRGAYRAWYAAGDCSNCGGFRVRVA
jgi:formylglycine-generating enzyme